MKPEKCAVLFLFLTCMAFPSMAEIHLGVGINHNQWDQQWLTSPTAEFGFSTKWFWLLSDATFGTYQPFQGNADKIMQIRASLTPMLRIPLFRPFYAGAGYGLVTRFGTKERTRSTGQLEKLDYIFNRGELRAVLGMGFVIKSHLKLYVKGGYHYIDNHNKYYSVTAGIGFLPSGKKDQPQTADKPDAETLRKNRILYESPPGTPEIFENRATPQDQPPPLPVKNTPAIHGPVKTVALVRADDIMINELNTSIEIALNHAGITSISWEKLEEEVREQMNRMSGHESDTFQELGIPSPDTPSGALNLAFIATRFIHFDAIIETHLRYIYREYGGEIVIHSAYIRMIDAKSGTLLWAVQYTDKEFGLRECQERVISDLLNALQKMEKSK